ncbi:hypothetical protein [Vibrio casei]|uniref:hypothetical protein n=1 Tax=Vibrio casei TaxID=673372 RepID=UPI003F97065B
MNTDLTFNGLFKGNNGKWSMVRVLSFFCVCGAIPFIYINPEQSVNGVGLAGLGMTCKWLSKGKEAK